MRQKIYVGYRIKNGQTECIGFNFKKEDIMKHILDDKCKDCSYEYVLHKKIYNDGVIKTVSFERV